MGKLIPDKIYYSQDLHVREHDGVIDIICPRENRILLRVTINTAEQLALDLQRKAARARFLDRRRNPDVIRIPFRRRQIKPVS